MGINSKTVIDIAVAEIGYLEKASNNSLDDKTANAGSGNWTKYARDLDALGNFYNGKKNGYSWCDVFVDWCFVKAYGVETAKKLLGQPDKSMGAGCQYSADYYKKDKRWYSAPQAGDQVFFRTSSSAYAHTGLVTKVVDGYIYTVEGNTNNGTAVIPNGGSVCAKKYAINSNSIVGFGRPTYDNPGAAVDTGGNDMAMKTVRRGDRDYAVKVLQSILNGVNKASLVVDGDFGYQTDVAVKNYQAAKSLVVDGVVGTKTWNALLGI